MIPGFNSKGNLPAGLHKATLDEFEARFVREPISSTREDIFRGYLDYRAELEPLCVAIKQWIDGSFTTAKQNPSDIDLVTQWDGTKVDQNRDLQIKLTSLMNQKNMKVKYKCDTYGFPKYSEEDPLYQKTLTWRSYWLGLFGFTRGEDPDPKGIIEFKF
jgi:hypothetical protein